MKITNSFKETSRGDRDEIVNIEFKNKTEFTTVASLLSDAAARNLKEYNDENKNYDDFMNIHDFLCSRSVPNPDDADSNEPLSTFLYPEQANELLSLLITIAVKSEINQQQLILDATSEIIKNMHEEYEKKPDETWMHKKAKEYTDAMDRIRKMAEK